MKLMSFFATLTAMGCSGPLGYNFNSIEVVSSRNERLYINSVNWGVTGDKQRTIVTHQKERLQFDEDTTGTVDGLTPFIYSFKNDTLKLFFNGSVSYNVKEKFTTITLLYVKMENPEFMELARLASSNQDYHFVPHVRTIPNRSMPKPPTNR